MDFVAAVRRNLTTPAYATFRGRASRSEYWWFYLFTILFGAAVSMLSDRLGNVASVAFLLPSLALFARRLHDVGRSGKWFFIAFTGVGVLLLLYWLVKRSDDGPNRFGAGPATA